MKVRDLLDALLRFDKDKTVCVAVGSGYRHIEGVTAPDRVAIMIPTIELGPEVDWRWPDVDGPSMIAADAPVDLARDAAEQLLVRATDEGIIKDDDWQQSTPDGRRFLVNFGTGDGLEEYTASEVVGRLNNPEFLATIRRAQQRDVRQEVFKTVGSSMSHEFHVYGQEEPVVAQIEAMDYPKLRGYVDECVRTLNDLVVAHTKNGLEMPARLWKAIEEADLLVNQVQDAIPVRTVIRYPAWLDVYVHSIADDHRIIKVTAMAQGSDAGNLSDKTSGFALEHEDADVADSVLRFTDRATWPDPKLES